MQMPSYGYQPPNPPLPYAPPQPDPAHENARMLALGILNVFFGYVYGFLTFTILVGIGGYRLGIADILQICALGWAAFAFFVGGILLLRNNKPVGLMRSAFWVVFTAFLVSMCAVLTQVASRYHGAVIGTYLTQIFLFCFYPLVVNFISGRLDDEYIY